MKLVVFGGRDYVDEATAWAAMDGIHRYRPVHLVIHGGAYGADRLAEHWAKDRGIPLKPFPAHWREIDVAGAVVRFNRFGKPYNALAGHWRNQRMVNFGPDMALQFPGGSGTADMRVRCDLAGVRVVQVYSDKHDVPYFPLTVKALGAFHDALAQRRFGDLTQ